MTDITTTQALDLFAKALQGANKSRYTIRAYNNDLTQFVTFVSERRVDWQHLSRFSRYDIVEFLTFLGTKNLTGISRARKLSAIKSFFAFLVENSFLTQNVAVTVKSPAKEDKEPAVLQKNEYKALLFEAHDNPRDYAIIMLFLQAGLRVSELVALTLSDVDLENRLLVVRQGKGKKDRSIPLGEQEVTAIKHYLTERVGTDDALFTARNATSLDVRSVRYIVAKYMKASGIKKKASVHTLRHTYGAHKINNGMPVEALQGLMGHKRKETTYHYIHLVKTNLRQLQEQTAL
jgi:integrase/recombinase XerC